MTMRDALQNQATRNMYDSIRTDSVFMQAISDLIKHNASCDQFTVFVKREFTSVSTHIDFAALYAAFKKLNTLN